MCTETKKRKWGMLARAFNRGSDARLRGEPAHANPYPEGEPPHLLWRQGWQDVDLYWGADARWPVTPLAPVEYWRRN